MRLAGHSRRSVPASRDAPRNLTGSSPPLSNQARRPSPTACQHATCCCPKTIAVACSHAVPAPFARRRTTPFPLRHSRQSFCQAVHVASEEAPLPALHNDCRDLAKHSEERIAPDSRSCPQSKTVRTGPEGLVRLISAFHCPSADASEDAPALAALTIIRGRMPFAMATSKGWLAD